MQYVRKSNVVKVVTKGDGWYSAKVMIAEPNFHNSTLFVEDTRM